jgi:hypothetical protein
MFTACSNAIQQEVGMRRIIFVFAAVGITMLMIVPALAKGPPDKVTITGSGLQDQVEVTERALLNDFDLVSLIDWEHPAPAASVPLDEGYQILFSYKGSLGQLMPAFQLHYFPAPAGKLGTIYNSSAETGPWFYAKPQGDAAMKQLLAQHGVSTLPATGAAPHSVLWSFVLAGGVILAGLLSRRFSLHRIER